MEEAGYSLQPMGSGRLMCAKETNGGASIWIEQVLNVQCRDHCGRMCLHPPLPLELVDESSPTPLGQISLRWSQRSDGGESRDGNGGV